jgi:hypothetical protein
MLMYSANDQLFVGLRELPTDCYGPIGPNLAAEIGQSASNPVRGLEKDRQAGFGAEALKPKLAVF